MFAIVPCSLFVCTVFANNRLNQALLTITIIFACDIVLIRLAGCAENELNEERKEQKFL